MNGVFLKSSPLLKWHFIIALFIVCLTMLALTSNFCSSSSSFQNNRCRCNVRIPSIVPLWDKWKEIFIVFQGPKLFNSVSPENHDASSIDVFLSKPKSLIFSWCKLTVFYFFGAFSFFSSSSFFLFFTFFYPCL